MTYSEVDFSPAYITIMEQKISELEVRYIQKQQRLEQQRSTLVTKDMPSVSSKMPSSKTGQPHVPCKYYGSADHQTLVQRETYTPQAKLRFIVPYTFVNC